MAEHTSSPTGRPGGAYESTTSSTSQSGGTATRVVDRVKERATAQLSSQKDRATDGLGNMASAVRDTTQTLREHQHETMAKYVEQAADQIERLSERLKNKDVTELLDDAQRLARRQPALFVGGAFALGLVGARFLKSSSPRSEGEYGYDRSRIPPAYGSTPTPYGGYPSTSPAVGAGTTGSSVQPPVTTSRPSRTTPEPAGESFDTSRSRNRERF